MPFTFTKFLLVAAVLFSSVGSAAARISGGTGNEPIKDHNWPAGAVDIFNFKGRVAYWEGPPRGGGHWRAECRGDAKQLSDVLAAFDRIKAKDKRVVVHDGVGQSFWLNPNRDPAKTEAAKIDWTFAVWDQESWQRIMDVKKADDAPGDAMEPPVQIDVYTGGNVNWQDVVVPKGLTVVDQRK
jgi:hypothetical protein